MEKVELVISLDDATMATAVAVASLLAGSDGLSALCNIREIFNFDKDKVDDKKNG